MRHKVIRCHLAMGGHRVYHCGCSFLQKSPLFTWKVEWPSDNFGSLNYSTVMCSTPSTGTKWMDVLIVLSSYCNTICFMAGHRGVWLCGLNFLPFVFFPKLKYHFCILGKKDSTGILCVHVKKFKRLLQTCGAGNTIRIMIKFRHQPHYKTPLVFNFLCLLYNGS